MEEMQAESKLLCGVCYELVTESQPHFAIARDEASFMCVECTIKYMVPKFNQALQHEHFWPPKWGSTLIEPESFADLLGEDFITAYHLKVIEYKTPPGERVYCSREVANPNPAELRYTENGEYAGAMEQCNGYVGRRGTGGSFCSRCGEGLCTTCEGLIKVNRLHKCPGLRPVDDAEDRQFDGLQRGIEWQQCPYCGRKCERSQGCNEMTCPCNEHFCFICGKGVPPSERREHWTRAAGCPRYRDHSANDLGEDDFDFAEDEEDAPGSPDMDEDANDVQIFGNFGTPGSDNDFEGAALENEAMMANDADPDPRRPLLAELRSAFNAVHNNPILHANPRDNPHYVDILENLVADRFTIHNAISTNQQAANDFIASGLAGMWPNELQARNHTILFLFSLQLFISILLVPFTDANVDLNNVQHALILARFEAERAAETTIADDIGADVEDLFNARTDMSYRLQDLIMRLLDELAAQATPAMTTPVDGPTPRIDDTTPVGTPATFNRGHPYPSTPEEGPTPHIHDSP